MKEELRISQIIYPSLCDLEGKLSVAGVFSLFMDIATQHAEHLGVGAKDMLSRGLFWLTVKTKVRILRRPGMMETVTLTTCPLVPERMRAIREYAMEQNGELLAQGKTEWAVLDTTTGRLHPMKGIFAPVLTLSDEPAFPAAFSRMDPDFSGCETLGTWTVRATDIDLGGHMNNVAYLRALLSLLPSGELKAFPEGNVELFFRNSCFEGDELTFLRRPTPCGLEFGAFRPDGTPAILVRAEDAQASRGA